MSEPFEHAESNMSDNAIAGKTEAPQTITAPDSDNAIGLTSKCWLRQETDYAQTKFFFRIQKKVSLENPTHAPNLEKARDPLANALIHLNLAAESLPEGETKLSLGRILHAVGGEGPSLAAALLTLPFLQPIPMPGLSTPIGFTLAILGLGIFLNKEIKLPGRFSEASLPASSVLKATNYLVAFERKLKPYLKSDTRFNSVAHQRFLGAAIAIHGFLLALPLPIPFSNTMPAWMCFMGAMTILFASWRLYAVSILLVLLNIAFWSALIYGAVWGARFF